MKTHPTAEEWMSFLYGEESPERQLEYDEHLRACAECRQQVQTWRGSMSALEAWAIPQKQRRRSTQPALRWAAAAMLILGLGFGMGRGSSSSAQVKQMRAELRNEMNASLAAVREEFAGSLRRQQAEFVETIHSAASEAASEETQSLFTRFAKLLDERRQSDQRNYLAALKEVEEQHLNRYATLRQDLDTVAVNADDGLSRTQEQLMELATIAKPSGN